MTEHLEQQIVNEIRALLKPLNEKYKDFFHLNLMTLCDLKDMKCTECENSLTDQKCMRCVFIFEELNK